MTIRDESEPLLLKEHKNGSYVTYNAVYAQKDNVTETSPTPPRSPEPHHFTIPEEDRITYTWQDINVRTGDTMCEKISRFVRLKKERLPSKVLLSNVTGKAKPGELLAIMGSSGAGKTTLLNVLTFRSYRNLQVSGSRCVNGTPVTGKTLSSLSGYVQQVDLFIGTLTVKEQLIFHAMLKMDRNLNFSKRLQRVEEVMMELNLVKCENTLIGIPGRIKGISGGEMKRLSFASEVLTDPPLLFCDEPTSGLDSFMAQNVVSVMRQMAAKGKTVISTIHQPSSEVYAMFDKIIFLSQGKLAFLGSLGEATTFFKSLGAECPSNHNPADFYIHLLAVAPGKEAECKETIAMICESYAASNLGKDLVATVSSATRLADPAVQKRKRSPFYKANWAAQFRAVFWRSWINVLKEPTLIRAKLIQTTMVALLIGLIYFQQELDQDGVMNINGAIFIALTNMTFQNMFAVIHVFCGELPIFMREHMNGMYRTDVYFITKTLAEIPIFIALPTIFTCIIYYMIGLNPPIERFLGAIIVLVLIGNIATSFGYFMSCVSSNIAMALSISPPIVIPFLLFGGFFLNTRTIPSYMEWFKHCSWFKYGNEALLINQWKGVEDIACTRPNTTCPRDGFIVLETLNFDETYYYFDLLMLFVILLVLRILAFSALLFRACFKLI